MTRERPKLRAILHFGPPKTATSALQAWCYENSEVLARHGIRYGRIESPRDPKHQWLVRSLRRGNFSRLVNEVSILQSGKAHTLILSCEGVMVHRGSVPAAHWQKFRNIMEGIESTLFLVRRDPASWINSLWKQQIINPVPPGKRLQMMELAGFSRLPAVREMMDLPAISHKMKNESGATQAVVADLGDETLASFRTLLDLPPQAITKDLPRENEALPDTFISVYRQLARVTDNVAVLRMAFFGLFVACHPCRNIMLSNVARKFESSPAETRRSAIDVLIAAIDRSSFMHVADAELAARIRIAAVSL